MIPSIYQHQPAASHNADNESFSAQHQAPHTDNPQTGAADGTNAPAFAPVNHVPYPWQYGDGSDIGEINRAYARAATYPLFDEGPGLELDSEGFTVGGGVGEGTASSVPSASWREHLERGNHLFVYEDRAHSPADSTTGSSADTTSSFSATEGYRADGMFVHHNFYSPPAGQYNGSIQPNQSVNDTTTVAPQFEPTHESAPEVPPTGLPQNPGLAARLSPASMFPAAAVWADAPRLPVRAQEPQPVDGDGDIIPLQAAIPLAIDWAIQLVLGAGAAQPSANVATPPVLPAGPPPRRPDTPRPEANPADAETKKGRPTLRRLTIPPGDKPAPVNRVAAAANHTAASAVPAAKDSVPATLLGNKGQLCHQSGGSGTTEAMTNATAYQPAPQDASGSAEAGTGLADGSESPAPKRARVGNGDGMTGGQKGGAASHNVRSGGSTVPAPQRVRTTLTLNLPRKARQESDDDDVLNFGGPEEIAETDVAPPRTPSPLQFRAPRANEPRLAFRPTEMADDAGLFAMSVRRLRDGWSNFPGCWSYTWPGYGRNPESAWYDDARYTLAPHRPILPHHDWLSLRIVSKDIHADLCMADVPDSPLQPVVPFPEAPMPFAPANPLPFPFPDIIPEPEFDAPHARAQSGAPLSRYAASEAAAGTRGRKLDKGKEKARRGRTMSEPGFKRRRW